MIQNLIFGIFFFFLRISFGAYNFYIFDHTFRWTSLEFFFNFRFSSRKSQSQPKIFLTVSCQKICTVPYLDAQELYSYSTLKANVYIFLNISVTTFLLQRRSLILSDCGWVWGEAEQFP